MANTIEFIIKATDKASDVVASIETKITTGAEKASKSLDNLTKTSDQSQRGFSNLQAAMVTANQAVDLIGRGFGIAKQIIDQTLESTVAYAKEVRNLSTNLGITAEETSKIIQASDDYGISVESVTGALQMAVKRGFAPNIETLAKLADEYNSIQSPTERAARLTDVFGRGWTTLTPLLKAGGQAIRDAAAEAEKLGLVLSDKDVQGARALEVSIDNLNDRVDALKLKVGKDLVPAAINVTDALAKFGDVVQGTETPLDVMNRELQYLISFTGKDSEVTKAAEKAIAEYTQRTEEQAEAEKGLEKQLGLTNNEKRLRLAMLPPELNGYSDSTQAILDEDQAMKNYNETLAKTTAEKRDITIATASLAIQYTESQKKQAEVQKELDALNEKIASHGAARVVTLKNEKMNAEELTKTQLELAVAQEDLAGAQKKEGESAAEFALRVENLKGKVADYSQKLGEHTAVVGGATKAELEQKTALEGQIAALQKADEIDRAKGAFESLTQAFRDGTLTQGQYEERAAALNAVTGLYTDAALKQATAQETLMLSFTDPSSEKWRGQLLLNQAAIDGQVEKTKGLTKATDTAAESLKKIGVIPPIEIPLTPKTDAGSKEAFQKAAESYAPKGIEIPIKPKVEATDAAAESLKKLGIIPPTITPKVDTTQATKDFDAFYTGKVGTIPAEKRTNFVAVTAPATKDAQALLNLFGTTPAKKSTEFTIQADEALQTYDTLYIAQERLHDKIIDILVRYRTEGEPVSAFQRGVDMVVPANPRGGAGDYFPFIAAPGERVMVQTPAQQMTNAAEPRGGDTYIYNTNVYNPLAAAMLADKQRRDRLARSNARMGVS